MLTFRALLTNLTNPTTPRLQRSQPRSLTPSKEHDMTPTLAADDWVWQFIFNHPSIIGVVGLLIVVFAFVEGRLLHGKVAGGITLFFGLFCVLYGFGGWNPISGLGAILLSWGMSQKPIGFTGGVAIFLGVVFLTGAFEGDSGLNRARITNKSFALSSSRC